MRGRYCYLFGGLIAICLLAFGCQSYYFDFTEGLTVEATKVTTAVYNTTPTDILFVIDNSGTMAEEQAELIKNAEKFITAMVESPNNFRIGVITTDTVHYHGGFAHDRDQCCMHIPCTQSSDCNNKTNILEPRETDVCDKSTGTCRSKCTSDYDCLPGEECPAATGDEARYCTIKEGFICNDTEKRPNFCDHGQLRSPTGQPFMVNDGVEEWFMRRPADNSALEKKKLIDNFQKTIKSLGVRGTTFEAGLEAMILALSGHNDDFPRPEADLAVIFLSDENDCSITNDTNYKTMAAKGQNNCYDENSANILEPAASYVQKLVAIKGDISKVRAAAIIGVMPWSISDVDRPEPPLGYYAAGCFQQGPNGASNACCCLSGVATDSFNPADDLYCKMLNEEPYKQITCGQSNPRQPTQPGQEFGGCTTMPGSRYLEFLEKLAADREAAGLTADTLVDSICSAGYEATLINIVNSVILNDCFTLEKKPTDGANSLQVILNGAELPHVADGSSKGWRYMEKGNKVCLTGGLHKNLNDEFSITIVTSSKGKANGKASE